LRRDGWGLMDDFDRDIWCLLGVPLDAVTMAQALTRVRRAARARTRCFLSTPNLNFLVTAQADTAFRESVVESDLSLADGMPLVWLARVLGLPIRERVAGSDLFEALRREGSDRAQGGAPLKELSVFFFGGPAGVAEKACVRLNAASGEMRCTGWHYPGFVPVEGMSGGDVIAKINASDADFWVVSLGARKGQAWILRNLARLAVPVVSHLGAVVNFLAGSVSRAPKWVQRAGLEWLWRIKEEPALWLRYVRDGLVLLRLVATRVLPYVLWRWSRRFRLSASLDVPASVEVHGTSGGGANDHGANRATPGAMRRRFAPDRSLTRAFSQGERGNGSTEQDGDCRVILAGALVAANLQPVRRALREAAAQCVNITADLGQVTDVDCAFLVLLMVLRKHVRAAGCRLRVEGTSASVRRVFRLNAATYLLE
jgi:N-acetylglucosaminyldiphosphoundecaprenol N-acetyl-beta-D-mannosaminyltransferase